MTSFKEFFPYYLSQHQNKTCIKLHILGTGLSFIISLGGLLVARDYWMYFVAAGIITAYVLAWIGHLYYEGNYPATWKHPLYSFMGDLVMFVRYIKKKIK